MKLELPKLQLPSRVATHPKPYAGLSTLQAISPIVTILLLTKLHHGEQQSRTHRAGAQKPLLHSNRRAWSRRQRRGMVREHHSQKLHTERTTTKLTSTSRVFLAESLRPRLQNVKWIFPHAPNIPITGNAGMRMPGWYDISDFAGLADRSEDEAGITRSQKVFHNLIAEEVKSGIPAERIVLGGFSQGGAMSLLAGLTCSSKLGGIFGLSCYLLLQNKLQEMIPGDKPNLKTPVFMGHGDADPLVRVEWGQRTAEKIREWGYEVDFKTYRGVPHSASPQEIDDLEKWLKERLPDVEGKAGGNA